MVKLFAWLAFGCVVVAAAAKWDTLHRLIQQIDNAHPKWKPRLGNIALAGAILNGAIPLAFKLVPSDVDRRVTEIETQVTTMGLILEYEYECPGSPCRVPARGTSSSLLGGMSVTFGAKDGQGPIPAQFAREEFDGYYLRSDHSIDYLAVTSLLSASLEPPKHHVGDFASCREVMFSMADTATVGGMGRPMRLKLIFKVNGLPRIGCVIEAPLLAPAPVGVFHWKGEVPVLPAAL